MFFQGQNGQSTTSYVCEKNLKIFVGDADEQDAQNFRDSLKLYLKEEKEFRELQEKIAVKHSAKEQKLAEAFTTHIQCLRHIHSKYGQQMVTATYNEFDHKIHIDPDKKMYVVVKECVIDDLDKPLKLDLPEIVIEDDGDLD